MHTLVEDNAVVRLGIRQHNRASSFGGFRSAAVWRGSLSNRIFCADTVFVERGYQFHYEGIQLVSVFGCKNLSRQFADSLFQIDRWHR